MCGTSVTKIRGIDISPNMVKEYNAAAGTSGAYAIEGDLFAAEGVPEQFQTPEFSEFDVAVVGLGFHHFENPKLALERLAGRLKGVTGVLVIVDFLPFKHVHSHGGAAAATIKHHGFTPEDMRDLYTAAGFVDFDIVALKKPAVMEMKDGTISERTIFLAKGRKSGTVLQRLGAWLGSAQDVVGGQMQVDRRDPKWNPGAGSDASAKGWDMVGRRKGDEWDGYEDEDRAEKKAWNGF
jgi:SAM-dependent methyltransferase